MIEAHFSSVRKRRIIGFVEACRKGTMPKVFSALFRRLLGMQLTAA
ncbi:MAG: hypothetical protein HPY66_2243 [Firmicutes bacterium]|nr:hypothetical protein [Bacillota bacterium]